MDQVTTVTARANVYGADASDLAASAAKAAAAFAGENGRVDTITISDATLSGELGTASAWGAVAEIVVKLSHAEA